MFLTYLIYLPNRRRKSGDLKDNPIASAQNIAYTDHRVTRGAIKATEPAAKVEGDYVYDVMYEEPDTALRKVQQFRGQCAPRRDLPPSPREQPVNPAETSANDSGSSSVRTTTAPGDTELADSAAEGHYY